MCRSRVAVIVIVCAFLSPAGVASTLAKGEPGKDRSAQPPAAQTKTEASEPAVGGYCLSSYLIDRKAVKGDPKFQTKFRGHVYYHASAARKKAFDEDPAKYLPAYDGFCTTSLGGPFGERIPSDPRVFYIDDGRLFLFSSTRAMRPFLKDPKYYILRADQRFNGPALGGYCPVSYVVHHQAIKGSIRHTGVYHGKMYHFVDPYALRLFDQDPDKYLPQYEGFCPVSLADKKKVKGDPLVFLSDGGKTFLFADEAARDTFKKNPEEIIQKADAAWPLFQKPPK